MGSARASIVVSSIVTSAKVGSAETSPSSPTSPGPPTPTTRIRPVSVTKCEPPDTVTVPPTREMSVSGPNPNPGATSIRVPSTTIAAGAWDRKPKAVGAAEVSVSPTTGSEAKVPPPAKRSTSAVLAWNEPSTSTSAPAPKRIPAGLIRKRLAPGMPDRSVPKIWEASPPVTRQMTNRVCCVAVKSAVAVEPRLKTKKEWKRFCPARCPTSSGIVMVPEPSGRRISTPPSDPSVWMSVGTSTGARGGSGMDCMREASWLAQARSISPGGAPAACETARRAATRATTDLMASSPSD